MSKTIEELKAEGEAPEWLTNTGWKALKKLIQPNETPKLAMHRLANRASSILNNKIDPSEFFNIFWKGWLGPATPVWISFGSTKGSPISCFTAQTPDSIEGIAFAYGEFMNMTKQGGGVGIGWNDIRARGVPITGKGNSNGVVPWNKNQDSLTISTSQGGRRGASSSNLNIDHGDFDEWLDMRRPQGDVNLQCPNIHTCAVIDDSFMTRLYEGEVEATRRWQKLLKTRWETGEPYIMFAGNVNNANPEAYKRSNMQVSLTNICSEIVLFTDELHSSVCCLSSLNVAKYDEWKDTNAPFLAQCFLDAVLSEFIDKNKDNIYMIRAFRGAVKGRPTGVGQMGFHTYLQSKMIPMDSLLAKSFNIHIAKNIHSQTWEASRWLAQEFGEPEWCEGLGIRNTFTTAIAPTKQNSRIGGQCSPGIEPYDSNYYVEEGGDSYVFRNPNLNKVLLSHDKDNEEIWKSILDKNGSVQHLKFLSEEERNSFRTAREIDQKVLLDLAADRQKFIDQSQSLSLFFGASVDPRYFSDLHIYAYEKGIKTLYYKFGMAVYEADKAAREPERKILVEQVADDCIFCEG